MPVYILRVKVPSAPKKSTEIMIKGATLEEALKGAEVDIFSSQRTVSPSSYEYKGEVRHYKSICYRRFLVRKIIL